MKLICKTTKKIGYYHRKTAWVEADLFFKKFGTITGVYRCRDCRRFHLSRKAQFTPSKKAQKIIKS